MNPVPAQREYFLDSIRAWLMLLGIPFHISLIYSSHTWHVNSAEPSLWLTLFNDFIHSFRMQVFFVISGYFSYMLFLRYPLKKWWKVRVERVGIPMLTAIPLLTLPQFIMLQYVKGKAESWPGLSLYDKYNTLAWELISHLWSLLVLVVMTTLCVWIFKRIRNNLENSDKTNKKFSMVKLSVIFLCLGIGYAVIRRTIFIVYPPILSNGMFNFIVMQTLFYLPFFILGALAFIFPHHPQLPIELSVGNSQDVMQAVLDFRVDIGFIEGPCHSTEIISEPWLEDELVVFAAPTSPLARGPVTLEQLAAAPWILRERGSGTREIVDYLLLSHLPKFEMAMELGNSEAIKHAVRHGLGISCLSRRVIEDQLQAGTLSEVAVPLPRLMRTLWRIHHRQKHLSNALRRFLDYCDPANVPR